MADTADSEEAHTGGLEPQARHVIYCGGELYPTTQEVRKKI